MQPGFQHFDPMDKRFARQIRLWPSHLDERELEWEPRVAALPLVLDHDREKVDQTQHGGLRKLVRLLAQPVARLLGQRQGFGHVAQVLHEQQVPEVLQELLRELAQVLAALGELLDEHERPRDVPVDDRVAEAEQRILLDRRPELQHVLHRDLLPRRGGELVEGRDRVPERSSRAAGDRARAPSRERRSPRRRRPGEAR